ncbi:MAG: hypothetical protein ABWY12_12125 [Burkholderiales bacterium]
MKIPGLGKIASFALNKIVIPAIGRAIADKSNPLTVARATDALVEAAQAEALRQAGKRFGV